MHTITLNVQDNIYENIMFLLKNLNLKGFEIKEEKYTIPQKENHKLDAFYSSLGSADGLFENKTIQSIKATMNE